MPRSLVILVVAGLLVITSGQGAGQDHAVPPLERLGARAEAGESIHVIVGLRGRWVAEGALGSSRAAREQREAISAGRENALATVASDDIRDVRPFAIIPYFSAEVSAAALRALGDHPDVVSIEEDLAEPLALDDSTLLIGSTVAAPRGYTGAGSTIAIVDTGVDKTHPFLSGRVVSEACYSNGAGGGVSVCPGGINSEVSGAGVNCTAVAGCEHGTHVAGIAAGHGSSVFGVAREREPDLGSGVHALRQRHHLRRRPPSVPAFLRERSDPCAGARVRVALCLQDRRRQLEPGRWSLLRPGVMRRGQPVAKGSHRQPAVGRHCRRRGLRQRGIAIGAQRAGVLVGRQRRLHARRRGRGLPWRHRVVVLEQRAVSPSPCARPGDHLVGARRGLCGVPGDVDGRGARVRSLGAAEAAEGRPHGRRGARCSHAHRRHRHRSAQWRRETPRASRQRAR